MNYRHAFHAGNFADLQKHALLLYLLRSLKADARPFTLIDTHAGRGAYDLSSPEAVRTGEAQAGVARLLAPDLAPPPELAALTAAVLAENPQGGLRIYPGSPVLAARALRSGDALVACEAQEPEAKALRAAIGRVANCSVIEGDGWSEAVARALSAPHRLLVLIDPPFERDDDHDQTVRTTQSILKRNSAAIIAIWSPIKDLAGFDRFLCELEDHVAESAILSVQLRMRALTDPMRFNGSAMVFVNPPEGLETAARVVTDWLAAHLGEPGARSQIERLGA